MLRKRSEKIIMLALLIVIIFPQCMGCGSNRGKRPVDELAIIIPQELAAKYHRAARDFALCEIEKMDRGVNFADYYYFAKVKVQDFSEAFDVSIELDGTQMKDNYEGLLYGDYVEKNLEEVLKRHTDIVFTRSSITYEISGAISRDAEEYGKKGNATYDASGIVQADSAESAADSVKSFLDDLQKNGFNICADISYDSRKAVLIYECGNVVSRERILRNYEEG